MRFRPDQPHAQVYGLPGVQWQQHGRYYRHNGELVDGDPDRERQIADMEQQLTDPKLPVEVREHYRKRLAALREPVAEPEPVVAAAVEAPPVPKVDMRRKENRHLRHAMATIYGDVEEPA
jgi:hypothetical protein